MYLDLRYALRGMRRSPGFTTVAAMSLALGVGANTAIFSIVETAMLRMLPVSHPEQLVELLQKYPASLAETATGHGRVMRTFASESMLLVYAGHAPSFNLDGLQGKVALIDFATNARKFSEMDRPWGVYPSDARFPSEYKPARGVVGHFAGPWVPSMRGVIQKYPDLIKKAVAALSVEHLGCKEWADDASMQYKSTGENEWAVAITEHASTGNILVDALQGSRDRKTAVVNPVHGGWLGEGGSLARAGVPTIGYIPQPNYLLAGPADGCIEKLSAERLHAEIEVFAKVIHKMDAMSAAELRVKS